MNSNSIKAIIIEKNDAFRDYLRSIISNAGILSYCFQTENTCLDNLNVIEPDLIVTGSMSQKRIIQIINALKAIECELPMLIISEGNNLQAYVESNGLENITIVDKPVQLDAFINNFTKAEYKKAKSKAKKRVPFIVGNDPEVIKIKKVIPQLSRSKDSILIKGEKGVGKETLARAIHLYSNGKDELFIKIDACALSSQQTSWRLVDFFAEPGLNGKKEDAIKRNRVNGTLYFEEICDIPDSLQSELLLFEERNASSAINPDLNGINCFRIIAGTAKNIDQMVEKNEFRKDLYYRMNVFDLKIPALRNRAEDIPLLADFFTYKFCMTYKKGFFTLSDKIKKVFLKYQWPGNIKELESAVKRVVMIRDEKKFLSSFHLDSGKATRAAGKQWFDSMTSLDKLIDPKEYIGKIDTMSLKDICCEGMAKVEKNIMKKALDNTNWNRKKAAGMLNISYKSMLNKIKNYKLT
jgi:DNA-binding NtrC family response regulator